MIDTQNTKLLLLTPPGAIVDNAAVAVAELDTLGWDYVDIYVGLGATDIAVAAMKLTQSDTAGSGHADVTGGDFSVSPATLPSATDDNLLFAWHINMVGKKRYLDLVLTGGDGTAGAYFVAFAVLSRGREFPSTAAGRGLSQELFV